MPITSPYNCSHCKKPLPFGVSYCPHCGHQQTTNTGQLWMGDRRLVTIIFADLASFTSTSEKADPEDVIDMLNQVFTRLAVEYDREGGYLDKTVGDQLMVLFGAPRAHEDDPVRAVRAALGMQAAMEEMAPVMREKVGHAFKLNIGINTGIVVWGRMGPAGRTAATAIGDDVNLASRLEHYATDGQIIVSDPVYSLTRRYFEYEVLEPIQVKGKSKPIPIYRPLGTRRRSQLRRQVSPSKTPLIERERELQILHAHWSQATAGRAQLVMLLSEAGLGKSRLITEFVDDLENHNFRKTPLVLHAYGQMGSSRAYSPLSEILSQLFDLKPDEPGLAARRKVEDRGRIAGIVASNFVPLMGYLLGWYQDDERLANNEDSIEKLRQSAIQVAVSLILKQAARRPLIITIDNLHEADADSLEWLQLLARRKATEQTVAYDLLVLAATRPRLEIPIETFQADKVINLNALSQPARLDLIASLLPGSGLPVSLVNRLATESGGNPFYLEEAARGLVQSEQLVRRDGKWELTRPIEEIYVPHSIEGQVMAHLDVLDEKSRIVLQHASVIGTHFDRNLLAAITPFEDIDQTLENLKQRALITEVIEPDGKNREYTFAQMMVREVAYRSMLRKARREIHERIAKLTEEAENELETKDGNVASLAHHYAAGGHEEKMVIYNWLAGQRALETGEFAEACQHLEIAFNALKEIESPSADMTSKVINALGDASTLAGKFDQAAACYQQIWERVKSDPKNLVTLYYRIGRLNFFQGNIEAASTSYDYARRLIKYSPELLPQIEADIRLMYDLEQ